jgi:hypothetical protein
MQEEKQPPSLHMFPGLEDAVEAEPLALAHHMNLYARKAFADFASWTISRSGSRTTSFLGEFLEDLFWWRDILKLQVPFKRIAMVSK